MCSLYVLQNKAIVDSTLRPRVPLTRATGNTASHTTGTPRQAVTPSGHAHATPPSSRYDVIHKTGSTQRLAPPPGEDRARQQAAYT